MPRLLLFICSLFLLAHSALVAQTLQVVHNQVLFDQPAAILAQGLQPNEHITLQSNLTDGAAQLWTASAEFVADSQGTVDTSKQAPVKGSYKTASGLGLIWAMKPVAKNVVGYRFPANLAPQITTLRLLRGNQQLAVSALVQTVLPEGIQRINIDGTIHGVLLEPSTPGRHPAVLVLGGSEGGLPLVKAAWLASHGFAAFALAYFKYPGLPQELQSIPLEYFVQALQWMAARPEIDNNEIGIVGGSRGGELALQIAAMVPRIKAVVAYVPANARHSSCCGPTSIAHPAWTFQGQPLSYVTGDPNESPAAEVSATIPVQQIHGAILIISGGQDGIWHSSAMADKILANLNAAHFAFPVEHLDYPQAGHLAGFPEIMPAWHKVTTDYRSLGAGRGSRVFSHSPDNYGGSVAANAASTLDADPKVIEFLQKNLQATPAVARVP